MEKVLTGPVACARHRADDRARIDAAREERAERHVRDETHAHRLVQQRAQALRGSRPRSRRASAEGFGELEVPIALDVDAAVLERQVAARREFLNAAQDAERVGHVAEREVRVERFGVQPRAATPGVASRDFSSEPKTSVPSRRERVVERLLADAVARDEQLALARVPDREAEHAAQAFDARRAELLVGVDDRLRVGVGVTKRWPRDSSSRRSSR